MRPPADDRAAARPGAAGTGPRPRMVVGITGASGAIYGVRLLERLREAGVETHLVVSKAGALTLRHETGLGPRDVAAIADVTHPVGDVGAACASGSFRTIGMAIAPCSMRTLAEIASGATATLLTRAADVALKERRRLVLMVRETPLSLIHIRNMAAVTEAGAIVAPAAPAFYAAPRTVDDVVDQSVARVLDLFDIEAPGARRWQGLAAGAGEGGRRG